MRRSVLLVAVLASTQAAASGLAPQDEARVVAALGSDSFKVRIQAAVTLGQEGSPAVVGPVSRLLSDPVPAVRAAAASSLGKLGAPAAIEPLAMAAEDADLFVRGQIRDAIVALAAPGSFDRLWAAAQNAGTHGRRALATAIARIDSDEARLALLHLSADPDPGVREVGTDAIVALEPRARARLLERGLLATLSRVRSRSALLAGRTGSSSLIPALAALVAGPDEIDEVRRVAKRAIFELRAAIDTDEQLRVLRGSDDLERQVQAAVLLGVCGGDGALLALTQALTGDNPRLRWAAAQGLADRAGPEAIAAIRSAAQREVELGARARLERLARDASQPPEWMSIALGN